MLVFLFKQVFFKLHLKQVKQAGHKRSIFVILKGEDETKVK